LRKRWMKVVAYPDASAFVASQADPITSISPPSRRVWSFGV
jgi:hypothetical protein